MQSVPNVIDCKYDWFVGATLCCKNVDFWFRWLNTLGIAAAHGIDVVLRHSLFDYGYNHLVDQHFNPLPVSAFKHTNWVINTSDV